MDFIHGVVTKESAEGLQAALILTTQGLGPRVPNHGPHLA
jgi:hypothetical protein